MESALIITFEALAFSVKTEGTASMIFRVLSVWYRVQKTQYPLAGVSHSTLAFKTWEKVTLRERGPFWKRGQHTGHRYEVDGQVSTYDL